MEYSTGNIPVLLNSNGNRFRSLRVSYVLVLLFSSLFPFIFNVELKAQCAVTATVSRNTDAACQNDASPIITFTGANGTAPYTFTYRVNGGNNQTITSITGNAATISVPTAIAGTFTYDLVNVSDVNNCSKSQKGSATVTVNTLPTATISGNATVCENTSSPNIKFSGNNGSSPYTFTYSLNSGASQTITTLGNSVNLAVPTGTPGNYIYTLLKVADVNGCSQSQTGVATVTVMANSTMNLSSAAGTNAQTICLGGTINTITYAIGGGATGATLSGSLPSGVTGLYSAGVFTITGTPVVAGTFNYTVSTTGSCNNFSLNGSIKVNTVTPGAIATNQTICNGGDPSLLTNSSSATGGGAITYQWQRSTTDCITGFSDISGAISSTYNPPAGLAVTTYYRRVAISTLSGVACSSVSNCATVTIHDLSAGIIGNDQTFCSPADPPAFLTVTPATSSGAISYQWQSSTTGCAGIFTNISGATAALYNEPSGLTLTTYYRRVATSTVNGVTCSLNSNCVTVTVNNVTPGAIAGNQTVCGGSAFTLTETTAATGTGILNYQWQTNTTSCGSAFTNIIGATSATYNVPAGLAVTTFFRRVVNSTINGVVCTAISNCLTVTVNNISGGTISGDQTICSGDDPGAFINNIPANGTNAITFQWQRSTIDCNTGFSNVSGATLSTYDPPVGLTVTTYYRRVATSVLNGVVCSSNSNCVIVTVHDLTPGSIATDQTICSGGDPAAFSSVAATSSGSISYQWQKSTTGCSGTFSNISGATANIYNEPAGVTVTSYYRRVATSTVNGVTCSLNSNCVTVTVNDVTPGTVIGNQTVCGGGAFALTETTAATGTGSLTYQWQSNTTDCGSAFTNIIGATSANYNVPAGLTVTTFFRRVVNSTINGFVCSATSECLTVTINNVNGGIISGSQTYCNGGNPVAFTSSVEATGTSAVAYQWQSSTINCTTGFSDISGATLNTYAPPAGIIITTYYRRVATSIVNGVTCTSNSNCLTIFINDVAAGTVTGTQTICAGGDPSIFTSAIAAAGSGVVTYQWQSSIADCNTGFSNISGANSGTYDVPAGLSVTTYYKRIVTSTLNGVICTATANCITVTVNPLPVMTSASTATICSGSALNIPLTSSIAASYTWIAANNPNTTGESITTETTGTINNTIFNNSTTVQTIVYTVIPKSTASGCFGQLKH